MLVKEKQSKGEKRMNTDNRDQAVVAGCEYFDEVNRRWLPVPSFWIGQNARLSAISFGSNPVNPITEGRKREE